MRSRLNNHAHSNSSTHDLFLPSITEANQLPLSALLKALSPVLQSLAVSATPPSPSQHWWFAQFHSTLARMHTDTHKTLAHTHTHTLTHRRPCEKELQLRRCGLFEKDSETALWRQCWEQIAEKFGWCRTHVVKKNQKISLSYTHTHIHRHINNTINRKQTRSTCLHQVHTVHNIQFQTVKNLQYVCMSHPLITQLYRQPFTK